MSAPIRLDPKKIEAIAKKVRIRDQDGEGFIPFTFNNEQRVTALAAFTYGWVYVLKARQVGLTTFWLLYDVLWVLAHDAIGKPVRCILLWDSEDNVKGKVALCGWFCSELNIKVTQTTMKIVFPGGSEIVGLTAGGRTPGRGLDGADRIHASEMPYWLQGTETWQGIMALVSEDKSVTIETTMNMREPLAANLWERPNRFYKLFLKVSDHASYRAPHLVKHLRPDERELLEEEGFDLSDPEQESAGAWWLNKLRVDCDGDWTLLKRDFPQKPEHAFAVAEGRWVKRNPAVLEPIEVVRIEGQIGERWELEVWRDPEDVQGLCVIGVDTSEGVGLDYSTVCVYDSYDGAICASFCENTIIYDDHARVVKEAYERFTIHGGYAARAERFFKPTIVVEGNGPGGNTCTALDAANIPFEKFSTDKESKHRGMRHVKRAVEAGKAYGPKCLEEESKSCHYEKGDFRGRKDFLMSYGFCENAAEQVLGIDLDEKLKLHDPHEFAKRRRRNSRKKKPL